MLLNHCFAAGGAGWQAEPNGQKGFFSEEGTLWNSSALLPILHFLISKDVSKWPLPPGKESTFPAIMPSQLLGSVPSNLRQNSGPSLKLLPVTLSRI